jgi:hypothetical protein
MERPTVQVLNVRDMKNIKGGKTPNGGGGNPPPGPDLRD